MPKQKIQGEGDYEATRRYRKRTDEYLKTTTWRRPRFGRRRLAREAEDMKAAEAAGKRRAKGEDPALRRRSAPRVEPSTRGKGSRN